MTLDKAALEHDEIWERLTLDCEQRAMIQASHNKLFAQTEGDDSLATTTKVQSGPPIEKQHDYNLLLLHANRGIGSSITASCNAKARRGHWPEPPELQHPPGID